MFVPLHSLVNLHTLSFPTSVIFTSFTLLVTFTLNHFTTHNSNKFFCSEMTYFLLDSSYNSFTILDTPSVHFPLSWQPIGCWHWNPSICVPPCFTLSPFFLIPSCTIWRAQHRKLQKGWKMSRGPSFWHIRLGVSGLELSSRWTHT